MIQPMTLSDDEPSEEEEVVQSEHDLAEEAAKAQALREAEAADALLAIEQRQRELREREVRTRREAQRKRRLRAQRASRESIGSDVGDPTDIAFLDRPTYDQELRIQEQEELATLRELLARPVGSGMGRSNTRSSAADDHEHSEGGLANGNATDRAVGSSSSSSRLVSSTRDGNFTDRAFAQRHEDLTGRWADRSGRSLPGRWNKAPFKPVPHALRGLTPAAGVSQNEPWSADVLDTCARLDSSPSHALYATTGLKRLDDGMYDDIAMLHRRRAEEDALASSSTNRPVWDPTPWHSFPAALRGIKPVTKEPWDRDLEAYNERGARIAHNSETGPSTTLNVTHITRDIERSVSVASWMRAPGEEKPPWRDY